MGHSSAAGDMIAGKSEPGTLASPQVVNAVPRPTVHDDGVIQHRGSIILVISSGAAKITATRSPSLPAGMMAGAPFAGPSWLESVMKRRLQHRRKGRPRVDRLLFKECLARCDYLSIE